MNKKAAYRTVTVQAAVSGWIVTVKGQTPRVFYRWEMVERMLKEELTSNYLTETKDATEGREEEET